MMGPRMTPRTAQCPRCLLNASRHASKSRYFTSTSTHRERALIPVFEPTTSPKLDALLALFRKTIFVPARLPKSQRSVVFKESRHQELKQNPITLQNGEEDIKVEPVLRAELPNIDAELNEMIRLAAEEPKDFRVLSKVLQGLKQARQKHNASVIAKIARTANDMGLQWLNIHCARAVKRTGFSLGHHAVANEVILGAHLTAQKSNWTKEALDIAIKNASDIAQMLDEPEHSLKGGDYRTEGKAGRLRAERWAKINAQPYFVGIQLELLAMNAVKYQGGEDVEGKVRNCAEKLLATWRNFPHELYSRDSTGTKSPRSTLLRWLPTWNGIKAALKVKGLAPSHVKALREHLTSLDQSLIEAYEDTRAMEQERAAQGEEILPEWRRVLLMYDELSSLKI